MGPIKFLYNSKFDFTAKFLVTNTVIIIGVLCTFKCTSLFWDLNACLLNTGCLLNRGGHEGRPLRQATKTPVWEIVVHLAVAWDVYDGVFLSCPFSHEMSWVRSCTLLSQFLRGFLPTFTVLIREEASLTKTPQSPLLETDDMLGQIIRKKMFNATVI